MYTFIDRGKRSITLRPENTASAVRAFIEHKMYAEPDPAKLFYIGPMFRYDRPQAGRQRQFHQFGVELLGAPGPNADAEIILLAVQISEDQYGGLSGMPSGLSAEAAGLLPASSGGTLRRLPFPF